MGQTARGAFVPVGTHVLYGESHDFRTRLARYLMDPVLPALMVVLIGVLTVAIIVLLVTTVATAILHAQPDVGSIIDPWLGISSDSSLPCDEDIFYPDDSFVEGGRSDLRANSPAVC